jgi:hypothetical protein
MFRIIIERPRRGAGHAPAVKLKRDRTDRKQVSPRRHALECAAYTKSLNENLAPLVRFFRRRVGRRWDDVFSEICTQLDTGSTVKMHVRQHLRDFVLIVSHGRRGELLWEGHAVRPDRYYGGRSEYYVDPDDGILKDRIGFWRCRGIEVPASKRGLKWGRFP